MKIRNSLILLAACWVIIILFGCKKDGTGKGCIQPYAYNPRYWQYKGEPVLLLGGTNNDNLFQSPDIEEQLDLLQSVGGNFIRNTMSSRDSGDVRPFYRQEDGKYDLDKWNTEYWSRFEKLLKLASDRDVIIQIEVWDWFDYSTEPWTKNPFNPANNINYSEKECGLAVAYPEHPGSDLQPFFHTVEGIPNYSPVLELEKKYQQKLVDKLLSCSLNYGNVLYCIDNEFGGSRKWSDYWAGYIKSKATEANKTIEITEMFDSKIEDLFYVIEQRDLYSFVEGNKIFAPQKWAPQGEEQWYKILEVFLESQMKMWEIEPHLGLLENRETDEAYLSANPGKRYALYFTDEGSVGLDLKGYKQSFKLKWIDLKTGDWGKEMQITGGEVVQISAPEKGGWLAAIVKL